MSAAPTATKATYAGLFLVTLATLVFEILLTRIFSVTMWYHFAFMAVSIAMFGMTLGALLVYLRPQAYRAGTLQQHLGASAFLFGLLMVVGVLLHVEMGPLYHGDREWLALAGTFLVIMLPFLYSGVCVCLALTRFPEQTSLLYAADLLGAALGCVLVIGLLQIMDGITAVVAAAFLAVLGSICFLAGERCTLRWTAVAVAVVLGGLTVANAVFAHHQDALLRISWAKGQPEHPVHEKWNSFSRLIVREGPTGPFGWSLSSAYRPEGGVAHYWIMIDSTAGTLLTAFDGDLQKVGYLKYEISNFVHYLRPDAKVLVIGSGGGTDILSALVFGQKEVVGVEMNEDTLDLLTRRFGDYTGHLDRYPQVRFVNDEARSFVARRQELSDIIQITYIDTWAATAAGAFVLSENSLYTRDSWKVFLEHLTPRGILTVSRGYTDDRPYEIYRMTALAQAALLDLGVQKPADHLVVIANRQPIPQASFGNMATVLVSREPYTEQDLRKLAEMCEQLHFEVLLGPRMGSDSTYRQLVSGAGLAEVEAKVGLDLEPPTSDKPFFFQMLRLEDCFRIGVGASITDANHKAVSVLSELLVFVFVLTGLCIVGPLWWAGRKQPRRDAVPLLIYFGCIGLGFMFVEISQMQRLIVFLGHPIYGLSTILFALLLAGGLGSALTNRVQSAALRSAGLSRLGLLLIALMLFGLTTPAIITHLSAASTPVRVLASVGILFVLGLFMGMAFPLGMRLALATTPQLTPWFWGINGATSVLASVLAIAIALMFGITASYWTGVGCYLAAGLAFAAATKSSNLLATD